MFKMGKEKSEKNTVGIKKNITYYHPLASRLYYKCTSSENDS